MDLDPVPGFGASRRTLRRRGIAATAVIAMLAAVVGAYQGLKPDDTVNVTIRTSAVAAGIVDGAKVLVDGLEVGTVADVRRLGHGWQGVEVALSPRQSAGLTDSVEVAFSAGNLFGVSEVVLTPRGGGAPLTDGGEFTPRRPITDNTVSNMIVTVGDINDDAVRPNMTGVLAGLDATTEAMLPVLTAIGSLAGAASDTQRVPTGRSLAQLLATVRTTGTTVGAMLPATDSLAGLDFMHGPDAAKIRASLDRGTNDERTGLLAALERILDPDAVAGLRAAVPVLNALIAPIPAAFAHADEVGVQLSELMNAVRAAMRNRGGVPVLEVLVSAQYPGPGD